MLKRVITMAVLVFVMGTMMLLGSALTLTGECEDTEDTVASEITEVDEASDDEEVIEEAEADQIETAEPEPVEEVAEPEPEAEVVPFCTELMPADIIDMQTGLHVDYIKLIDKYPKGHWAAYYLCADGDVYVVTIKNDNVDVCCQLN